MKNYDRRPVAYASYKLDGISVTIGTRTDGTLAVLTSEYNDVARQLDKRGLTFGVMTAVYQGYVLRGELWVPGSPASEVKRALATPDDDRLVFDCWEVKGKSFLQSAETCVLHGVPFVPWVPVQETLALTPLPSYRGAEVEGWVLVASDGERLKWKPVRTLEALVTGTRDGRGKYLGLVGALEASVLFADGQWRPVASVGGMTDAERVKMSDHSPVGRVAEVAYQYVGAGGRLRHPRFVRFRDDKRASDCVSSQDADLEIRRRPET